MMSDSSPFPDRITILKDERAIGPFDFDEVLTMIEAGEIDYEDVCLREGKLETERLRDVLDWEESPVKGENSDEAIEPEHFDEDQALAVDAILYRGHRSILTYPLSFLGLTGGVVGACWLYPIDLRFTAAFAVVALISLVYLTLMRFTCDYLVTPKRVEAISGLIARSSREVRIVDLKAINVSCSGFLGMFGVGTVDFFTVGDLPEVTFEKIWSARKLKTLVRRLHEDPPV